MGLTTPVGLRPIFIESARRSPLTFTRAASRPALPIKIWRNPGAIRKKSSKVSIKARQPRRSYWHHEVRTLMLVGTIRKDQSIEEGYGNWLPAPTRF
jgi:hypothetical protein